MKLRVVVKPHLRLIKEDLVKKYGEEFEVSTDRGIELLKYVYKGQVAVEYVPEEMPEVETLKAEIENLVQENSKLKEEIEVLNKKIEETENAEKKNSKGKGDKNE